MPMLPLPLADRRRRASSTSPTTGPAIFCPNHTSVIDSFFLPVVLPRRITFVGKAEYMDDWKTKYLFPGSGHDPDRPLRRQRRRAGPRTRRPGCSSGVSSSASTRRAPGPATGAPQGPHRRRPARAAHGRADHPGRDRRHPRDPAARRAGCPKPFKAARGARSARRSDVDRYADRADDRLVLRQIIDEVMFEIRDLTGQEYVDTYADEEGRALPTAPTARIPSSVGGNGHGPTASDEAPRRSSGRSARPLASRTGSAAFRARPVASPPWPTRSRSRCRTVPSAIAARRHHRRRSGRGDRARAWPRRR